ncbi:MAG: hypothetical protein ACK41F_12495 [Fimbriimonadaceae bacterium]
MPKAEKTSDVIEARAEFGLEWLIGGVIALAIGIVLWIYRGEGTLIGLTLLLLIGGGGATAYGAYILAKAKSVPSVDVVCSYCQKVNKLTAAPEEGFLCSFCHRRVPVRDGRPLPVFQVRCGYCNELNYYNETTEILICESCNHEIPIAQEEGRPTKHLPRGFVAQEDPNLYDLVLVEANPKHEGQIGALQHMLALNRNQVKEIMANTPAVLLTGITRKKAEMLQAQLAVHDARAEIRPTQG